MNQSGKLHLFGAPRWVDSSGTVVLLQGQFLWLLAYLGVQDDWVNRKDLAELLWENVELASGLNNLRQLLHRNKHLAWAQVLEASPQALRLTGETDIKRFRGACQAADWQTALLEYSGSLLKGLRPQGLEQLEGFFESERSILQSDWREALIGRTQTLERDGDFAELFELLQTLLEVDPYNEEALHSFLKQALVLGQQERGTRAFQAFGQRIRADLGLEPLAETLRLAALVSGSEIVARASNEANVRLLGRELEQTAIRAQLTNDSVRLLTLRGSGGVGKTALAKWVLEHLKSGFQDGAVWVSLQPVSVIEDVPLMIASELKLSLTANSSVWQQITESLRHQNLLLILDNLEHLRGVSESLVTLLEASPNLKLLVTSRVSLELPAESVLVLEGLDYPDEENLELAQSSSAVRLFVARAARRRAGFALSAQTMPGILRICKLVHGLPLGLELAAAWTGELSPDALADGLESNSDLPENETLGAHRSLRSVFEHSWELLEDELRTALSAVSVFRGGFERRAALEGLGVSARALLALVGRSLLQSLPGGRYDLHSVVQSFAAQKLETSAQEQIELAHAAYFTQFAEKAEMPLRCGGDQIGWLKRLSLEHQNFIVVCDTNADPSLVLRTVTALGRYWYLRGHSFEGLQRIQSALCLKTEDAKLLARAEVAAGIQGNFLSQYENSNTHLDNAIRIASTPELELIKAEALNWRAANDISQGDLLEIARTRLEEAISIQKNAGDTWGLVNSVNDLGRVFADEEDDQTAQQLFEQSLELAVLCQDLVGQGIAMINIANMLQTGERAKQLLLQSLAIKQELGNLGGIGMALHNLGSHTLEAKDHQTAKRYLIDAAEVLLSVGRQWSAAYSIGILAQPYVLEGRFEHALVLFGARTAGFDRINAKIAEHQYLYELEFEQQARDALGEEVAQAAYQKGYDMSLHEARSYASQILKQDETEVVAARVTV